MDNGCFTGGVIFVVTVIHKAIERFYGWYLKQFAPVDKSVILFRSKPDYSDNSRALADYMVMNGYTKKYKLYFDVSNLSKYKDCVEGISFVSCMNKWGWYKLREMHLLITAGYTMDTHAPLLAKLYTKPEQFKVRLWHGCGYKDRGKKEKVGFRNFDIALVPGKLFVKTKARFWNVEEKYILPIGYPRYNWLMKKNIKAKNLIETFKKDVNTTVIIWMPTFRNDKEGIHTDSKNISQFPLVAEKNQWMDLDCLCKKKNVVLIVKLHHLQPDYDIPFDNLVNIKKIDNSTFEKANVRMYEFLAQTDALISDYSSIAVDYLIVDRPIAFALQDYEEYNRTRGFVFENPREYMPGHHLYTFEDLKGFIYDVSVGSDLYQDKRKQMFNVAITRSNDYCKDVLDKIGIHK